MSATGYAALLLAMAASLYAAIAYAIGAKNHNETVTWTARGSLLASCGFITVAVLVMVLALVTHDFSIEYVANYSSLSSSLAYLVTALWAGNEGSLLFWAWLLSVFAVIVVLRRRAANSELVPYASAVIMLTQMFFVLLLISVANPFRQLGFVPPDGRGLNPMLENPGMIFHPPALLAGYVGITIPFAFAIAAMLKRKLGNDWLPAVRGWAVFAWLALGIGNIIGAWWAYVELGWGGYWAWDPVENAGLMPWLVITAFLHSIIVQRNRGMLRAWTLVLVILAFNLSIFGTFLTRSGVLASVHTYGVSAIGPFFLVFLAIALVGSIVLLISRRKDIGGEQEIEKLVSRESVFLLNNILLVGATAAIFVGTVFPGITEIFSGVRVEVGQSFFNQVSDPIFVAIILLIGFCTVIGWRAVSVGRRLAWSAGAAVLVGIVLFVLGVRQWEALVAGLVCAFVFFSVLFQWHRETADRRRAGKEGYAGSFWHLLKNNRPRYGGYIVHLAILLMAVGVIGSSVYDVEKDVSLEPGQSVNVEDYRLVYQGLSLEQTPDKQIVTATLQVYRGDRLITTMLPEKYFHRSFEQPVSEVAIHTTALEDLYIILAGWDAEQTAAFTILVNPLVAWLWIGGGILLIGGLVSFWPGKRRIVAVEPGKKAIAVEDEIEEQVRRLRQSRSRFCARCGARANEGDRFCAACGAPLEGSKKEN